MEWMPLNGFPIFVHGCADRSQDAASEWAELIKEVKARISCDDRSDDGVWGHRDRRRGLKLPASIS